MGSDSSKFTEPAEPEEAPPRSRTPSAWDLVRNSLDLGGVSFDSHEEAHAAAKTLLARLRAQKEAAALQLHEAHFVGSRAEHRDNFVLGFQDISYFNAGLEALIGPADSRIMDAMRAEYCSCADADDEYYAPNYGTTTTSRIEWHFVTNPTAAGLKACGIEEWPKETRNMGDAGAKPRVAKPLEAFEPERQSLNAQLSAIGVPPLQMEELIAMRLYLGPMYRKIQVALRVTISKLPGQEWRRRLFDEQNRGNAYCTMIHACSSAVVRLSKLRTRSEVVYCGLANGTLPDSFWRPASDDMPRGGTEIGFTGTTTDRDIASMYASSGGAAERGVLLEVQMGPFDSGADVAWLSQYPHEKEILLPPLVFHEVKSIETAKSPYEIPLLHVRSRLRVPSMMLTQPLLTSEEQQLLLEALSGPERTEADSSKFGGDVRSLIAGQPAEAARGLAHFMKIDETALRAGFDKGTAAIVAEVDAHGSTALKEHLHYVLHEPASEKEFPNGVRDRGRNGERLADFVSHPIATAHGLDEPRVAALRLYTTAAYSHINNPLRAGDRHPLPVTVAFIADGIKKLRAKRAEGAGATSTLTLWRGMRNLKIADDFLTERRGGTELAPCSTTTDIAVAAQYSASAESLLFKFRIANFMQFGAELQWLSAFPSEAEVLFPPLTYLQPTGRVERTSVGTANFTVVEVEPHLS